MLTVFFAMVKTITTAPNGTNFIAHMPHTAAIGCTAFSTNENSSQGVFAGICFGPFRRRTFNRADSLAAAFQLPLHQIEHFMRYDSRMAVLYQIFGELTNILTPLFGYRVCRISFLQNCVSCIFFIPQNAVNGGYIPLFFSRFSKVLSALQDRKSVV